jgi:hypothetical protein
MNRFHSSEEREKLLLRFSLHFHSNKKGLRPVQPNIAVHLDLAVRALVCVSVCVCVCVCVRVCVCV